VPLVRLQFRGLPDAQRKAFWFRNVTDARGRKFEGSVVLGALGSSRAIYAAALSTEPDRIAEAWARAHANHLKPRVVERKEAPVKEIVLHAPKLEGGVDRFPSDFDARIRSRALHYRGRLGDARSRDRLV